MQKITITAVLMLVVSMVTASAQTRLDKPNTDKNSDFLFMGNNDKDGTAISELKACIATGSPRTQMATVFKSWITDISEVAALKMYNMKRCDLVGFRMEDKPGRKYRTVDSFEEYAAGNTMYKVENNELVLVKKFVGEVYYIVVAKRAKAHSLNELDVCGPADIVQRLFKSRKRGPDKVSSTYCHNLQQQIDRVKKPTQYASHMKRTSAVLFTKKDYLAQKKKNLFRGKAVYTFDGADTIEPIN